MVYVSIDNTTKEGKALTAYLENLHVVQVYKEPNERTLKSMQAAKSGKVKEVKDVKKWFEKLLS